MHKDFSKVWRVSLKKYQRLCMHVLLTGTHLDHFHTPAVQGLPLGGWVLLYRYCQRIVETRYKLAC